MLRELVRKTKTASCASNADTRGGGREVGATRWVGEKATYLCPREGTKKAKELWLNDEGNIYVSCNIIHS